MISFALSDEDKMMQDSVAQFARTTLRPRARQFEASRSLPDDVILAAHGMGLGVAQLPTSSGGAGVGLTTVVLLEEELAWGDAASSFALAGPGAFALAVRSLGSEAQVQRLLSPFAAPGASGRGAAVAWGEPTPNRERPGLVTIATPTSGGWSLRGEKAYVINASGADSFVVFAQVDPSAGLRGVGAFIVRRDHPGVTVAPRLSTLGLDAASFGGLTLADVVVSREDRLEGPAGDGTRFGDALVRFFAKNALVMAARSVGVARAAFETTRDYCDSRVAFGKPIGHFQSVAFTLADRAMDVEAARALVWRAAWLWDSGADERDALRASAYAISFAHEAAMRAGDDAVQLHGGAGFMRDYPVEKLMRDAKQLQLCGMTSGQADQLAAAIELGLACDLSLVLPTAETQSVFV